MDRQAIWKKVLTIGQAIVYAGAMLAQSPDALNAQSPRGNARSSYTNRLHRQPVSPYLNLYRNDAGPLNNYQTLVRPQLAQQSVNQIQQSEISKLQQQATVSGDRTSVGARQTGHATRFQHYSHFYPPKRAGAP